MAQRAEQLAPPPAPSAPKTEPSEPILRTSKSLATLVQAAGRDQQTSRPLECRATGNCRRQAAPALPASPVRRLRNKTDCAGGLQATSFKRRPPIARQRGLIAPDIIYLSIQLSDLHVSRSQSSLAPNGPLNQSWIIWCQFARPIRHHKSG